jgi:hypothetical protein
VDVRARGRKRVRLFHTTSHRLYQVGNIDKKEFSQALPVMGLRVPRRISDALLESLDGYDHHRQTIDLWQLLRLLVKGTGTFNDAEVDALIEATKARPTDLQSSVEVMTGNWARKDNRFALRKVDTKDARQRTSGRQGGAGGDFISSLRDGGQDDMPQLVLSMRVSGTVDEDDPTATLHKKLREALATNLTRVTEVRWRAECGSAASHQRSLPCHGFQPVQHPHPVLTRTLTLHPAPCCTRPVNPSHVCTRWVVPPRPPPEARAP